MFLIISWLWGTIMGLKNSSVPPTQCSTLNSDFCCIKVVTAERAEKFWQFAELMNIGFFAGTPDH